MRIFNTLVTSDQNVASERTNGSLSVPRTLVADTFTGSVQTHKQNKYTLSRPRMHADTPSLTPRGAHMHHTTSTVRYRWFRDDRDTFHRRRPCRQEMASVGRPARQSCAVEGARRSSVPPCFYQQARAGRSKKRLKKLVSSQRTAHEPFEEGRRHRSNEKRLDFTPCIAVRNDCTSSR